MKLEQQVCSLDLAKRLKELGVKQESYAFWNARPNDPPVVLAGYELGAFNSLNTPKRSRIASAFTVAELGEIMKNLDGIYITSNFDSDEGLVWVCQINYWRNERTIGQTESADTEADARAKMLCYLLKNKLITLSA
jgi:hypothetical protein